MAFWGKWPAMFQPRLGPIQKSERIWAPRFWVLKTHKRHPNPDEAIWRGTNLTCELRR